jgi:hypothetical protein
MTKSERPIILRDHEVRAILDGRKTQTRRPTKLPRGACTECAAASVAHNDHGSGPDADLTRAVFGDAPYLRVPYCEHNDATGGRVRCPLGVPGDTLWVRECWCLAHPEYHSEAEGIRLGKPLGPDGRWCHYRATDDVDVDPNEASPWRSSVHMPRWASRLTLRITDVRVQRLQDISQADAKAEGVEPKRGAGCAAIYDTPPSLSYIVGFREAYCLEHGNAAWDANPWVWAISFEVQP